MEMPYASVCMRLLLIAGEIVAAGKVPRIRLVIIFCLVTTDHWAFAGHERSSIKMILSSISQTELI